MTHNKHDLSGENIDLSGGKTRDYYLSLAGDFESSFPEMVVTEHDGFKVVREDLIEVGGKARVGELLISSIKEHELVYVQPRFGFAGVSLCKLAEMYHKHLFLFMPACKEISDHQAYCLEHGAEPVFKRVAAMPNLNRIARSFADKHGFFFLPFGLKHELVTAMFVKNCDNLIKKHGHPSRVWCAISTGTMARGLAIGFHKSELHAVAVARNIKAGEAGTKHIYSSPYNFHYSLPTDIQPPFSSAPNYDAKAWLIAKEHFQPGDWFWNVAGQVFPTSSEIKKTTISNKKWGE